MPSLEVTFFGNARQLEATYARVEAMSVASARRQMAAVNHTFPQMPAPNPFNTRFNQREAADSRRDYVNWWNETILAADLTSASRGNRARSLWRQRGKDRAEAELAGEVDAASRSNAARSLWRQRAESRLGKTLAAEQAASSSVFWFNPGSKGRAADATAERVAAQSRLAGLTSTAYAADQVGQALGRAGKHGTSFSGAMREIVVVMREISEQRGAGRIIGSLTYLGQMAWQGFIAAIVSIPGLIAIAGTAIAYFTFKHLKAVNEALDKTAESAAKAFGDPFHAHIDSMMEGARAAGELKNRIAELGQVHETLVDQMNEAIRAMEEEFHLMREIARLKGETPAQEMAAEQEMRKRKLELVNQTLAKQKQIASEKKEAEEDADAAAFTGQDALLRQQQIKTLPEQLNEAKENAKKYQEMVNELEKVVDEKVTAQNFEDWETISKQQFSAEQTAKPRITKSGEEISLEDARGYLQKYNTELQRIPALMVRLEENQRALAEAASRAAQGDTKAADDVLVIQKQSKKLMDEIGLHDKYDSARGALSGGGRGGADLTANQRIGAFAMPQQTTMIDLTRQIVNNGKMTNEKLDTLIKNPPSDSSGYEN